MVLQNIPRVHCIFCYTHQPLKLDQDNFPLTKTVSCYIKTKIVLMTFNRGSRFETKKIKVVSTNHLQVMINSFGKLKRIYSSIEISVEDDRIIVLLLSAEKVNFVKYDRSRIDSLGVGYDYSSLMHFKETAFSKNGEPTIVPRQAGVRKPKYQFSLLVLDCFLTL